MEALNESGENNLEEIKNIMIHHYISDAISSISVNEEILKVNVTSEDMSYAQEISDKVRNDTKKEIESSFSTKEEYDHAKEFVRNKEKPAEECPPVFPEKENMPDENLPTPPGQQFPNQQPFENSK